MEKLQMYGNIFKRIGDLAQCKRLFNFYIFTFIFLFRFLESVKPFGYGPSFSLFAKPGFDRWPDFAEKLGIAVSVQRFFVFPEAVGEHDVGMIGIAQQLHAETIGLCGDFPLDRFEKGNEIFDLFRFEMKLDNSCDHLI